MNPKELIARRVAKDLKDGDVVNLGIGVPTLVANYLPEGIDVILHSENGIVGIGGKPQNPEDCDPEIVDAGGTFASFTPGAAVVDSNMSFGLIRGKHLDVTVLGMMEVDQEGNLANYMIPGKMVAGMGGAMDLVAGAKKVVAVGIHTANGKSKIMERCDLPLTGAHKVKTIVTDLAYFDVTDKGLVLRETAPGVTVEEVLKNTDCPVIVDENVKEMDI